MSSDDNKHTMPEGYYPTDETGLVWIQGAYPTPADSHNRFAIEITEEGKFRVDEIMVFDFRPDKVCMGDERKKTYDTPEKAAIALEAIEGGQNIGGQHFVKMNPNTQPPPKPSQSAGEQPLAPGKRLAQSDGNQTARDNIVLIVVSFVLGLVVGLLF